MDISTITVVVVLTGLAIAALVWMELQSRKNAGKNSGQGPTESEAASE